MRPAATHPWTAERHYVLGRDAELSDASGTQEKRAESAEQPVPQRQVGRPTATTTKHDKLLLEHKVLSNHRSHATRTTELRGHDGEVE